MTNWQPKPGDAVWLKDENKIIILPAGYTEIKYEYTDNLLPLTEAPVEDVDAFYTWFDKDWLLRAYQDSEGNYILKVVDSDLCASTEVCDKEVDCFYEFLFHKFLDGKPVMPAELADAIYGKGERPFPKRGE